MGQIVRAASMNLKKTILKIGKYLDKPVGYFLMTCMVVGMIGGVVIYPVIMLTEQFGWGWGTA